MAIKRKPSSEPIVSGTAAAPARGKNKVTRKHQSAAADTSEDPIASSSAIELPTPPVESPVTKPTFEEIAQLAYCYWEARGYQGGSPEHDWLRAERELTSAAVARV
jgi:Protein of unknown function (DUF2934)